MADINILNNFYIRYRGYYYIHSKYAVNGYGFLIVDENTFKRSIDINDTAIMNQINSVRAILLKMTTCYLVTDNVTTANIHLLYKWFHDYTITIDLAGQNTFVIISKDVAHSMREIIYESGDSKKLLNEEIGANMYNINKVIEYPNIPEEGELRDHSYKSKPWQPYMREINEKEELERMLRSAKESRLYKDAHIYRDHERDRYKCGK